MIKVMICGILGRLGAAVLQSCSNTEDIKVVCGIDHAATMPLEGPPVYSSFCEELPQSDILIDCSSASNQKQVLQFCKSRNMPLLSCVTGYSVLQNAAFSQYAAYYPILRCTNMASGIPMFLQLLQAALAGIAAESSDIIEVHRADKQDAPSGTALLIAQRMREMGCRPTVSSVRKNEAAGSHTVTLSFCSQEITITHVTKSHLAYGEGAVALVRQIVSLPNGLYHFP